MQEVVILPLRVQFDAYYVFFFFFFGETFQSLINQKIGKLTVIRLLMSEEIDSIQTENREENLVLFTKASATKLPCLGMRKTKVL